VLTLADARRRQAAITGDLQVIQRQGTHVTNDEIDVLVNRALGRVTPSTNRVEAEQAAIIQAQAKTIALLKSVVGTQAETIEAAKRAIASLESTVSIYEGSLARIGAKLGSDLEPAA
jgi:hypothetical protein